MADPGDSDEKSVVGAFGFSVSTGRATACFAAAVVDVVDVDDVERFVLGLRAAARLDVVRFVADADTGDGVTLVVLVVPETLAPRCWNAEAPPPAPA